MSTPADVQVRVPGGMPGIGTVLRVVHDAAQIGGFRGERPDQAAPQPP